MTRNSFGWNEKIAVIMRKNEKNSVQSENQQFLSKSFRHKNEKHKKDAVTNKRYESTFEKPKTGTD